MALASVPNRSNQAPRLKWRPDGGIEGAAEEDNYGHYCSITASQRERPPEGGTEGQHLMCPNVTCPNSPVYALAPSSPLTLSTFSTLCYRFYSFYIAPFYHVLLFYRCLPGFLLLPSSYTLLPSLRTHQHLQHLSNVSCAAKGTPLGSIGRWARTLGSAHRGSLLSLRRSLLHSPHSMGFIKWTLSLVIMFMFALQTHITGAQHAKQVRTVSLNFPLLVPICNEFMSFDYH